jgi:hypothetical protein
MRLALQYSAWAIGLWLNFLVIAVLARGSFRQYPFVFAYSLALFVSTLMQIGLQALPKPTWENFYWKNEIVLEIVLFCVVISFLDEAARSSRRKILQRHWLITAAALVFLVSYFIRRNPEHLNLQMTLISRDLNICATILDLILWVLLAAARRPDRRLMLLSGGLGLQFTGAIMGESLRHLSRDYRWLLMPGTLLEVVTDLLSLYIWWRALRTAPISQSTAIQRA